MRTLEQFISEARTRGRTRSEVRGIALSTQWKDRIPGVLEEYDRQASGTRQAAA